MAVKRTNRNNVRGTRSVTLALIAMLELLLLCVSLTFSWFERALDPILVGSDISTADALLTTFEVGSDGGTVDLSQYFEQGSKTKFSPVHSDDGIHFTSHAGVPMNTSEIHAAALSFQFKISASANCEFWLDSIELILNGTDVLSEEQREIYQDSSVNDEEEPSAEEVSEEVTEEESNETVTEEPTTETFIPEGTETEVIVTEVTTETEFPSDELQGESTTIEGTVQEEEKPATKASEASDYASAFVICFSDGTNYERFTFAEAQRYMADGDKKLFSYTGQEKIITCSIWLDNDDAEESGVVIPEGATFHINMLLTSSWSETRIIELWDETTALDSLYPQMGAEGYYVELIDTATGTVYPAVYDSESSTWCAEIPLAVEEFDVRYRSKGIDREIIATWESIDGREIHSFALMDEGVFLSA